MADPGYFNIENLTGQQVPTKIVEQLKVLGRVQFPLKHTTVSAVSTSAEEPSDTTLDNAARISGMIDHVDEMESITEQLEDMLDELTKNMNIPVDQTSPSVLDAVKTLGGDNYITKDIFDKALAIVDNGPIMLMNMDPMGIILGNGKLEGSYMNCDQITRGIAKTWNTANPKATDPNAPVKDASIEIAEDFEKGKNNMILEMLLMLWWNMIWPKFIIMLVIVNPIRTIIAYPMDTIVTFFKNMKDQCGIPRFKIKPKDCLKNYGPINKALNRLACFLLCKIPPKAYKRYKPMVEPSDFKIIKNGKLVPCNCDKLDDCPPKKESKFEFDKGGDFGELNKLMDNMDEPCATVEEFLENVDIKQPYGLGMPPECLKAAQVVLSAVISDALTPSDPSKMGITGSASVTSILEHQTKQFGA